jgi:hypothetical protein
MNKFRDIRHCTPIHADLRGEMQVTGKVPRGERNWGFGLNDLD